MKISLAPELPLVLAVNPTLTSNSLPTLLHEDLREDLMLRSSPFIGLPVVWAKKHEKEINVWTENFLQTRGIVERTSAEPKASFSAGQVSQMKVNVESRHYTIAAWAALYGAAFAVCRGSAAVTTNSTARISISPALRTTNWVDVPGAIEPALNSLPSETE